MRREATAPTYRVVEPCRVRRTRSSSTWRSATARSGRVASGSGRSKPSRCRAGARRSGRCPGHPRRTRARACPRAPNPGSCRGQRRFVGPAPGDVMRVDRHADALSFCPRRARARPRRVHVPPGPHVARARGRPGVQHQRALRAERAPDGARVARCSRVVRRAPPRGGHGRARMADVEFSGLKPRGDHDADVFVRVSWYRIEQEELLSTVVKQDWHDSAGWQLVSEERSSGDVGLLGEAVTSRPGAACRARPRAVSDAPARRSRRVNSYRVAGSGTERRRRSTSCPSRRSRVPWRSRLGT